MDPTEIFEPAPWKGALAGLAAGLVASLAMDAFQATLSRLFPSDHKGDPATEQAADWLAGVSMNRPLPSAIKPLAGQSVHYATGAALGLLYGSAVEFTPRLSWGRGAAFGLTTAALLDEIGVPAAGLGKAPWKTPGSTHAYTISSHLMFGTVTEGVRRLLRRGFG